MTLYGAAKAPATPSSTTGLTVATIDGTLTGAVDGEMEDVADIAISTSGGNTYSDDDVNTAVNVAIAEINLQLKELQTKLNDLIAHMNDGRV